MEQLCSAKSHTRRGDIHHRGAHHSMPQSSDPQILRDDVCQPASWLTPHCDRQSVNYSHITRIYPPLSHILAVGMARHEIQAHGGPGSWRGCFHHTLDHKQLQSSSVSTRFRPGMFLLLQCSALLGHPTVYSLLIIAIFQFTLGGNWRIRLRPYTRLLGQYISFYYRIRHQ